MEIGELKTVGIKDSETGLKDFEISTPSGEHFFVKRVDGNKWEACGSVFKTLTAVKHAICRGDLSDIKKESPKQLGKSRPTWDCIHPCVFMILGEELDHRLHMETLCKYGYLDSDGERPDIDRARTEANAYMRRTTHEPDSEQGA